MTIIALSHAAAAADPTLAAWLAGTGLRCAMIAAETPRERGDIRILHVDEIAHATHRDVLIALEEGAPLLTRAAAGRPASIRFGFADMAFGHALIAELVRPAGRPACGEPDSARFLSLAAKIAGSDATALVLGETGTGKEGVARFIHASSPRADKPFVAVNCAALPETMLEAMLFGHQKGSFTGASGASEGLFRAAEGGSLLLDEVAELPLALQAKLLRALQEREVLPVGATKPVAVDVRVIAAGNRDLAVEVAEGRFRADLYWRLNVMPLTLRPLSSRRLDVRAIAATLILRHTAAGDAVAWPTAEALAVLMAHDWPGNVRELENVLQRALLLREGERIEAHDLSIASAPSITMPAAAVASNVVEIVPQSVRLAEIAKSLQAKAIAEALAATGGHRLRAAERLGISERTLRYRLADMRAAA
ncbi:sigma 54-interacting transcriptional regulator [Sphingomonas solaris]|uniref:AAA family ATPase n=1 Tax=Alterirhizorhabdus solaris TaxID=2529389 RepID=A0A558R1B4_9SPHN|nr:sigma 54-interacting transcriptional regulator [Sphingomonas solaris]TVV73167.1 AAA family ATPase [Sphingomonas solaris]